MFSNKQEVEEVCRLPRAHRHTRTRSFTSTTTTTTVLTAHDLAEPLAKAQALLMADGAGVLVSADNSRRNNARGGSPVPGDYSARSRSTSPCRQANTSQALISSNHQQGQLLPVKNQQPAGGRRERNDELALVWDGMGPPPTVALATVTHASGAEVVLARDLEIGVRSTPLGYLHPPLICENIEVHQRTWHEELTENAACVCCWYRTV